MVNQSLNKLSTNFLSRAVEIDGLDTNGLIIRFLSPHKIRLTTCYDSNEIYDIVSYIHLSRYKKTSFYIFWMLVHTGVVNNITKIKTLFILVVDTY